MNYKIALIILSLTAMLVLTGCGGGDDGGTTAGGSSKTFNGGSEGVSVKFMENAPPAEVFDTVESVFDISIQLQNEGETNLDQSAATVTLTGIDPKDFDNPTMSQPVAFPLFGTKLDPQGRVIPGTTGNVDFTGFAFAQKIAGNVEFNVHANVCYPYKGKAIAKVCLRDNLLAPPKDSDVCEATRSIQPENSGSPVHIEDFAQSAIGKDTLSLSFKVRHVGRGSLFAPDNTVCDDSSIANEDKVKIVVDSSITCPGLGTDGIVKLFGGEKIITCTMKVADPGDYEKGLEIITEYYYRKSAMTSVFVRHIDEGTPGE